MDPVAGATWAAIAAAAFAAVSAGAAALAVTRMTRQLEQTAHHELARMANQHNWELFLNHAYLPPVLEVWGSLSDKGWAWRVLHLNHLNFLEMQFKDHARRLLPEEDFEAWKERAKMWFSHLKAEDADDPDIAEGRQTLMRILKHDEGYAESFRRWLRSEGIIPGDLWPEE